MHLRKVMGGTHNTNIKSKTPLPSPAQLKADIPLTSKSWQTVKAGRAVIADIIHGRDPRFLVCMGPCSVHNPRETLEYAQWLKTLQESLQKEGNRVYIVMRLVFVKPRTDKDWTGFFNDPRMDGTCAIDEGWRLGRELLLTVTEMGIPVATEYLDVNSLQNVDDLYSFYWIGARSIEYQGYRDEASALSTPVGFKHSIHGTLDSALSSMNWARQPTVLTAPDDSGVRARFATKGNPNGVLILRGTSQGPNFSPEHVANAEQALERKNLNPRVLIDVNHGNSGKDHLKQAEIIAGIGERLARGETRLAGVLYESTNSDGKQKLEVKYRQRPRLREGVSVTDGCDGIERSGKTILALNECLRNVTI